MLDTSKSRQEGVPIKWHNWLKRSWKAVSDQTGRWNIKVGLENNRWKFNAACK